MTDASIFDFEAMKQELGADPFAESKSRTYDKDERFYQLKRDENDNGAAIVRFLPDAERGMIQQMYKIGTTVTKNGKKRFVSEFSPSTIGLPCPFQEEWQALWNAGDKEGSKIYSRGTRYVANIKIIKDPRAPENEGKIFLYEMSNKMREKLRSAIDPSPQDRALGSTPKELFNPLRGHSFKLACSKGSNGQVNYDNSEIISDVTSVYDSVEEALADIKENAHLLSSLVQPEAFLSYDELLKKKAWVTFQDQVPTQGSNLVADVQTSKAQVQPEVQANQTTVSQVAQAQAQAQPAPVEQKQEAQSSSSSLDDLLASLT